MEPVEINAGTWYLRALRADDRIDDRPGLAELGENDPGYVDRSTDGPFDANMHRRMTTAGRNAGGHTISVPDQWVGPSTKTRWGSSSFTWAPSLLSSVK